MFSSRFSRPIVSGLVFGATAIAAAYAASVINGITTGTIQSGDTMAAGWYQAVNNAVVPSGAVMAFNLASCPTGWSELTSMRGRVVIGAGNGAGSTTSVGDTGGDKSAPAISGTVSVKGLSAQTSGGVNIPTTTKNVAGRINAASASFYAPDASDVAFPAATFTAGGTAPDNMQPYMALLYCQKN